MIITGHDKALLAIAKALDITETQYQEAEQHYKSIGRWLKQNAELAKYAPEIFPQGSFLLGTVIRPFNEDGEYDIDAVCQLKATKNDFSQKKLKEIIGEQLMQYAKQHSMRSPEQGRFCWTLHYAQNTQFHMDVIPALPDPHAHKLMLERKGHKEFIDKTPHINQAIAITDSKSAQYAHITDDWPQSNPLGYADWFRNQMLPILREQNRFLAEIADIPAYKNKTPLQRVIQLLKRYRDGVFSGNDEHKPSSIIITTLAAHAYKNEASIPETLTNILQSMDQYIEQRGGEYWIPNPVNPEENFANKWNETPKKAQMFYQWLNSARQGFMLYLKVCPAYSLPDELQKTMGENLIQKTLPKDRKPIDTKRNAETEIKRIQSSGSASKPWSR